MTSRPDELKSKTKYTADLCVLESKASPTDDHDQGSPTMGDVKPNMTNRQDDPLAQPLTSNKTHLPDETVTRMPMNDSKESPSRPDVHDGGPPPALQEHGQDAHHARDDLVPIWGAKPTWGAAQLWGAPLPPSAHHHSPARGYGHAQAVWLLFNFAQVYCDLVNSYLIHAIASGLTAGGVGGPVTVKSLGLHGSIWGVSDWSKCPGNVRHASQ